MGLLAAIAFLTRIPLPTRWSDDPAAEGEAARAAAWYPVVGLLLGALLAAIDHGVGPLLGPRLEAALLVGVLAAVTGALHLDGVADVADAIGSGRRGEAAYRILKDPHVGAFGMIAIVLVVVVDIEALSAIASGPSPARRVALLMLAPMVGRLTMVIGARLGRSPRFVTAGLGHALLAHLRWRHAAFAAFTTALAATGLALWSGLAARELVALGGGGLLVGLVALSRSAAVLPGVTGDQLGWACELAQTAAWVIGAAMCR